MNNTETFSTERKFWQFPWRYGESFLIAISLVIIGIALEYFSGGKGIKTLSFPKNTLAGIVFVNFVIVAYHYLGKSKLIRWASSIPASISAISAFTFLVLLMGFIQQNPDKQNYYLHVFGFDHINRSWMYLFVQVYFLTILSFVFMKRFIPFKKKNIGFLLNHFGLWLTIFSATLGSGDVLRLSMNLYNQRINATATDNAGYTYKLPFAIRLQKFDIEQYNPKIVIANTQTGIITQEKGQKSLLANEGVQGDIEDWKIKIVKYLASSQKVDSAFIPDDKMGASAAAFVSAKNNISGKIIEGWVCAGSFNMMTTFLKLNDSTVLAMLKPEPKKYSSKVEFFSASGEKDSAIIEVNKPFKYQAWKIYQLGFDEKMGKWSNLSIIELVKDPWLPLTYTGIFLMLAGAMYMFWIGKDIKKVESIVDADKNTSEDKNE